MKTISRSTMIKFLFIVIASIIGIVGYYIYSYNATYNSIEVIVSKKKKVEYGSTEYDINNLIDKVEGEIVSVVKDIDTSVVGKQEVILEVKKDNVIKEVSIDIEVVDSVQPVISLKEESISITKGDTLELLDNIESVNDNVDGDLAYFDKSIIDTETATNYYTIEGDIDTNTAGEYEIVVKAVDKSGNETKSIYKIVVEEPVVAYKTITYDSLPAYANSNQVVSIAYSLIGSPYVAGGTSPSGFDCSGFVQYVYSQVGLAISRSTSTQINDGYAVSYDSAQPGDILSWGYVDGVPTHSALYIGNGQMIHATNPRQGVILSDVAAWTRGSGTHVIAVRRLQ